MMRGVVVKALGRDASLLQRKRNARVFLHGIPRPKTIFNLIGKDIWIARSEKDLLRPHPRRRVVSMAVGGSAYKNGGDHQRTSEAHHPHHIVEDLILAPFLHRLREAF